MYAIKYRYRSVICGSNKYDIEPNVIIRNFSDKHRRLRIHLKGNNKIRRGAIIQGKGDLYIGLNTYISSYSIIGCNEKIIIGDNCMISQNVSIRDTDHNFEDLTVPMITQGISTDPIVIGNDVWVGHGVVITKGVSIGDGSIIGANAVVTKNVESSSIVGGVPAKLIRKRK